MNKKVDLLIEEPCPELLCGICTDVLEDPIQVHCPEDKKQLENCPICLTLLDKNSFQLSKFVQRQVGRLRIQCRYAKSGCPWQGLLSDNHLLECTFQPQSCPNAGCDATHLNEATMQEHLKTCLYQTMTCPNQMPLCQPFLRKDLAQHENECQSYTCIYAHEGCPFIGTLSQAKTHCDQYCGHLHQKIEHLEQEVKRLNKWIQDITMGLDVKLPSTPETQQQKEKDAMVAEMALFHQMLNENPFQGLDLTDVKEEPNPAMMDISQCLPDFLENQKSIDALFETAKSPQPLEFVPPVHAPKRTSNGKKIRYSKNVRLAHSALRMARQRTASTSNPSNDAILNNLNHAKKQQVAFKNQDSLIQTEEKTKPKSTKKEKKKPSSPQPDADTTTTTTLPKRRPMFILASSYLSNYNSNNNNNTV
ncbi:hypothetical protein CU098_011641 [Rhizopus stolonifer]|uniref:TRAF-type domain-containing protein n=1 Tax=Rhizopus stolonifer TaxID=4846 RepID=A0A367KJQ4_RHIST|nr:hypothetical protein CU098_011641 [Rhizopus stolonifer]